MKVYEINPENFGKYKHMLPGILKQPNMCGVFSQSCGHCQSMKPAWSKLKSTKPSVSSSHCLRVTGDVTMGSS